jgi:hypothetical protein
MLIFFWFGVAAVHGLFTFTATRTFQNEQVDVNCLGDGAFFDGNFFVRSRTGEVLWQSGTPVDPTAVLRFQDDGNIVIYAADGTVRWSSNAFFGRGPFTAIMQTDQNFVLYDRGNNPVFETRTANPMVNLNCPPVSATPSPTPTPSTPLPTPGPSSPPPPTPTRTPAQNLSASQTATSSLPDANNEPLAEDAVVGIAVGVTIVVLGCIVALGVLLVRKKKMREPNAKNKEAGANVLPVVTEVDVGIYASASSHVGSAAYGESPFSKL